MHLSCPVCESQAEFLVANLCPDCNEVLCEFDDSPENVMPRKRLPFPDPSLVADGCPTAPFTVEFDDTLDPPYAVYGERAGFRRMVGAIYGPGPVARALAHLLAAAPDFQRELMEQAQRLDDGEAVIIQPGSLHAARIKELLDRAWAPAP